MFVARRGGGGSGGGHSGSSGSHSDASHGSSGHSGIIGGHSSRGHGDNGAAELFGIIIGSIVGFVFVCLLVKWFCFGHGRCSKTTKIRNLQSQIQTKCGGHLLRPGMSLYELRNLSRSISKDQKLRKDIESTGNHHLVIATALPCVTLGIV
jgi:hypothetical protein